MWLEATAFFVSKVVVIFLRVGGVNKVISMKNIEKLYQTHPQKKKKKDYWHQKLNIEKKDSIKRRIANSLAGKKANEVWNGCELKKALGEAPGTP